MANCLVIIYAFPRSESGLVLPRSFKSSNQPLRYLQLPFRDLSISSLSTDTIRKTGSQAMSRGGKLAPEVNRYVANLDVLRASAC